MGLNSLFVLSGLRIIVAQESCYEAHYVELADLSAKSTVGQFITELMEYSSECHDHLRLVSLIYSVFLELGGHPVSHRYNWMRKAVHRHWMNWLWLSTQQDEGAGSGKPPTALLYLADARLVSEERFIAAFVDLGRPPMVPTPSAVRSTLLELTAMICLEFRMAPSDEQLHFYHQSGLLSYVGAVGAPVTDFLHDLAGRNDFALAEFLDVVSNSDFLNAYRMGTASPLIISELYPMYGTHGVLSLAKFWHLLGCYVMPHQLRDLLNGNIFLYRLDDALPSTQTEAKKEDAVFSLFLERELHLKPFIRYRHQFLYAWHSIRSEAAEAENAPGEGPFRELLRNVLTELANSKRNVWQSLQQQVSLVLMTLDFQYPALTEESFMHILHLTQLLVDEGDAFQADYQGANKSAMSSENRRQWSAPIRNTLKTKAHDYFQSLHFNAWAKLKASHIEQDAWQRLPVARNYKLLRAERLKPVLPRSTPAEVRNASEPQKPRTAENNPFRGYKPELTPAAMADGQLGDDPEASPLGAEAQGADEIDDHALLQYWVEDGSLSAEPIGSGLLSNSNRSPVISSSTVELGRILERYCRLMGAIPSLSLDIFQCAVQLVEFYVHCVLCLFVQDRHLRLLLEDLDGHVPAGDPRLPGRHDAFLVQRLFPELRRAAARTREMVSSLTLPDSCASYLGTQAPVNGSTLLQVTPFSKLAAPSVLCGLAERCVGVDSVRALLQSLQDSDGLGS
eukprot:s212_g17.t1